MIICLARTLATPENKLYKSSQSTMTSDDKLQQGHEDTSLLRADAPAVASDDPAPRRAGGSGASGTILFDLSTFDVRQAMVDVKRWWTTVATRTGLTAGAAQSRHRRLAVTLPD